MIGFRGELGANDIKRINKALKEFEPGLLKEIRAEIKSIAKPINDQIKRNIPSQPPMSGMAAVVKYKDGSYAVNEGRLRWDGKGNLAAKSATPQSTTVSSAIKASGRSLSTSLVKITLRSAPVSMVDMAGRVNKGRAISREYTYRKRNGELAKRRHRVTTQGNQFLANLQRKGGKASRFGWAALEGKIDAVAREIETRVLDKYYRKLNRRF
jgi:hypothetical protein